MDLSRHDIQFIEALAHGEAFSRIPESVNISKVKEAYLKACEAANISPEWTAGCGACLQRAMSVTYNHIIKPQRRAERVNNIRRVIAPAQTPTQDTQMTRKEIMEELTKRGVTFSKVARKSELIKLLSNG